MIETIKEKKRTLERKRRMNVEKALKINKRPANFRNIFIGGLPK